MKPPGKAPYPFLILIKLCCDVAILERNSVYAAFLSTARESFVLKVDLSKLSVVSMEPPEGERRPPVLEKSAENLFWFGFCILARLIDRLNSFLGSNNFLTSCGTVNSSSLPCLLVITTLTSLKRLFSFSILRLMSLSSELKNFEIPWKIWFPSKRVVEIGFNFLNSSCSLFFPSSIKRFRGLSSSIYCFENGKLIWRENLVKGDLAGWDSYCCLGLPNLTSPPSSASLPVVF